MSLVETMESFIWYQRPLLACKRVDQRSQQRSGKRGMSNPNKGRETDFHILEAKSQPYTPPRKASATPGHRTVADLDVAEVVASMAVKACVDQHCIQDIDDRLPVGL